MLEGRTAWVTGGGTGIGAAIATALAGAGAEVLITGRRSEPLEKTAAAQPGISWQSLDVTEESAITDLAKTRSFDILVANAGIAETAPVAKQSLADWRRTQAVNVEGPMLCTRAVLPGMMERGWGRVIYVSSVAGLKGLRYGGAYVASKHALNGLMKCVAEEALTSGVTANALCPGYVETDIVAENVGKIMARSGMSEDEALAVMRDANPFGRLIAPEEVAAAALWLCGQGSGAVTGQTIAINGGQV
jgi:NAD(P)-dependent dehydrogenase (short-subunit alcohol dehydrogenase family)